MPSHIRLGIGIGVVALSVSSMLAQRGSPTHAPTLPTLSSAAAEGHRLWVLLFDVSSLEGDDVARARTAAQDWIDRSVDKHDLVSVEAAGVSLTLLQNFTADPDRLKAALDGIKGRPAFSTAPPDDQDLQDRDLFNNDLRFRSLRALCTGLRAIEQRKTIMFFTATRERPGEDNQIEARGATDACNQANTTINPVDVHRPGGRDAGGW